MAERSSDLSLKAYVDGAWVKGGVGYGYIILDRSSVIAKRSESVPKGPWADSRQVGGELLATMAVIAWCEERMIPEITLFYDYEGIRSWALGLWKTNKEITRTYVAGIRRSSVRVRWMKVKSHSGDRYNDVVDLLAKDGAAGISAYWADTEYQEVGRG